MSVARITVEVREDSRLRPEAFRIASRDEPVAWLEVGEFEVSVYGSAAALRRLSGAALAAAEHAGELRRCLRGGKGVPDSVSAHPFVFATLTAPIFGHVHTRPLDKTAAPAGAAPGATRPSARMGSASPAARCTPRTTSASASHSAPTASTTTPP
jgi:hypothetical protein